MLLESLEDIMQKYNVSKATVHNWIRLGNIKTTKINNKIMVSKAEIENHRKDRLMTRRNKQDNTLMLIPNKYLMDKNLKETAISVLNVHNKFILEEKNEKLIILIMYKLLINNKVIKSLNEVVYDMEALPPEIKRIVKEGFPKVHFDPKDMEYVDAMAKIEIPNTQEDILGLLYLTIKSQGAKNKKGSYYTPQSIVKNVVNNLISHIDFIPNLLDPACGSGIFIIESYKKLVEKFGMDKKKEIIRSIHAYDTDKVAIAICRINFYLITEGYLSDNIRVCNSLLEKEKEKYHLVIGNPPWGYKFKDLELAELSITGKAMDSYGLFVHKGLELLKHKGVLSYLLPYSILNVRNHSSLRELLLHKHTIKRIEDIGPVFDGVFTGGINLVVCKVANANYSFVLDSKGHKTEVSKSNIMKMPNYNINFVRSNKTYDIIEKIRTIEFEKLKGKAEFALGIVTGNNKVHLKENEELGHEPIIMGSNILKYQIEPNLKYINFRPEQYQQVAPLSYYRAPEKLVYRFINKSLVFAYDCEKRLTLNSANILVPRISGFDIKYILAILNSSVIQFYHQNCHSGIKVLRHHIEELPLPRVTEKKQLEIINLVEHCLKNAEKTLNNSKEIDKEIYSLFQLNTREIEYIEQEVKNR